MSKFDLEAFINGNPNLLGEGEYKNYLYHKNRVDLAKPTVLNDVGLRAEKVLGQGEYINYLYGTRSSSR